MRRRGAILLGAIAVLAGCSRPAAEQRTPGPGLPPVVIGASALARRYAAGEPLDGKRLLVTGDVRDIARGPAAARIVLATGESPETVVATVDLRQAARLGQLRRGSLAGLLCDRVGFEQRRVTIGGCALRQIVSAPNES